MEEDSPVFLVTLVKKLPPLIDSNVEVYINNQQAYKSIGLYAHKFYVSSNFRKPIPTTREFFTVKCMTMKNLSMSLLALSCRKLLYREKENGQ